MSSSSLVSYVIPVFNKATYLPYTLASLAAQTGEFSREFIFIDDGSTDESADIIKQFTQNWPNVTYIYQENTGPVQATNRGIAKSQGQWVKLFDADDVLAPYATELLLTTQRKADVPLVLSPFIYWSEEATLNDFLSKPPHTTDFDFSPPDRLLAVMTAIPGNVASGMLVDRELLMKSGGCDERVFVQDYTLMLRLALLTEWVVLQAPLVACPGLYRGPSARISEGQQQRYDAISALYWFLKDYPDLDLRYFRLAAIKATGRTRHVASSKWGNAWDRLCAHRKALSKGKYLELIQKCLNQFDPATLRIPQKAKEF